MKPAPKDWPRFSSAVCYRDAAAAIDWLCDAFGFEIRLKVVGEGGRIEHSELTCGGEGILMVAQEQPDSERRARALLRSPQSLAGANTQAIMFFVDDADAHCVHAGARGARIIDQPETHDHGAEYWADRSYSALDPEGHLWWMVQRLRNPPA
jgi:uncharacterized glyoxalase superfamily protein PhnB